MQDEEPKTGRGGARPGAGRKPAEEKYERHHVTLPAWALVMLRTLGDGSISRGVVAALERLRGHETTTKGSTEDPHE